MIKRWKHDIEGVSRQEIVDYCVKDSEWQEFRLSLKGVPTIYKLERLERRKQELLGEDGKLSRRHQVQIDNYINALKRGGQLDLEGNVVR